MSGWAGAAAAAADPAAVWTIDRLQSAAPPNDVTDMTSAASLRVAPSLGEDPENAYGGVAPRSSFPFLFCQQKWPWIAIVRVRSR